MPEISLGRFSGFADSYDLVRPQPPPKLCEILLAYQKTSLVETILDLGCGTGLSTRIWQPYAKRVIGVEPNPEMRRTAQAQSRGIDYLDASSYDTLQAAASIDIVTCSQAFHWMEPKATIAEVSRILKPQGLFAVYDNQWPVSISWRAEQAYFRLLDGVRLLTGQSTDRLPVEHQWPKAKHPENLAASKCFDFVRTIYFDHQEPCDAQRFIGLGLSQGALQTLIKHHIAGVEPLIDSFKQAVIDDISGTGTMTVSYTLTLGIRG